MSPMYMMEPIRYTKHELLAWQQAGEVDGGWDNIVAAMGVPLYQELCSLDVADPSLLTRAQRRRNIDRRERPQQKTNPPLCLQPAENLICGFNGSPDGAHQDLSEEEDAFEDSDEEVSLQPLAFQVEGEPDFESGPPQDGFEYLRRVMWETAQCPKVKIAKIGDKKLLCKQTNYMPAIPPIPMCSLDLIPSKDWVQAFLKDFSDLRAVLPNTSALQEYTVEDLPPIRNKAVWKSLCFGPSRSNEILFDFQEDANTSSTDEEAFPKENVCEVVVHSPVLRVLLRLDEVSRATLFRYHVSWLKEQSNLAYDRAVWLFALAAVVDSPLDDQTSAAFRDLLRKCAELRLEKKLDNEELHMLNILVTIAGEYFGQAEHSSVINT